MQQVSIKKSFEKFRFLLGIHCDTPSLLTRRYVTQVTERRSHVNRMDDIVSLMIDICQPVGMTISLMRKPEDKQAFALRLSQALRFSRRQVRGATDLALQFNLRYPLAPITKQTAHKWLTGQSLPRPDKVDVLATWLGVSPHWLHFGPADAESVMPVVATNQSPQTDSIQESKEISDLILSLPVRQRYLVVALVKQLLGRD